MSLTVYTLSNLVELKKPIFMIGSFESFHIGHNLLYERAKELASQSEIERDIVIVYFSDVENLPKNHSVMFTDELFRLQAFAGIGIKYAVQLKYSIIRQMSPDNFIDTLVKKQNDFDLISGTDFKYGINAHGNIETLKNRFGNRFHPVQIMRLNNEQKVSTGFIKEALFAGDIDLVNILSVFKYGFHALIGKEDNRLKLDFRANLAKMRPGVYCANIEIANMYYYCLLTIHSNNERVIEMIDFTWTSDKKHQSKITINSFLRPFYPNSQEKINPDDVERAKEYFIYLSKK
ncbi:riboflavin biosynthesis protein [Mycoplasmopsis californica HAZ160_1]|uniref:FAD synthase n=2 Tax=Mycoplasmopsis californica TaxID=2113 RepID=A0A059XLK7_9BACT|nr:hypothetical protein [Mycoplasmopsis californica]AIA29414.1 hypothetical protein MCFN_01340 [Mycoplasmopsis californica]BAP01136.1 riboflavin biosynthesis protein [Mycoplasmopsis californica HAZ160_1]BBG41002.1 riboflavin biosynthesis protein [Mycoplasmopsis californica]BBG41595.1 riboflavin biosynthesis protein [Mycoplasmopsis californica]BBG42189.1 riboflavin biosynthesis protein [Mycoplasmopsis californica]